LDEKMFTVEPKLNRKTDGTWAKNHKKVPQKFKYVGRRQGPANVMVWAAVTTSGKKSPLVMVEKGGQDQHRAVPEDA
jgi:hypothetical protein